MNYLQTTDGGSNVCRPVGALVSLHINSRGYTPACGLSTPSGCFIPDNRQANGCHNQLAVIKGCPEGTTDHRQG